MVDNGKTPHLAAVPPLPGGPPQRKPDNSKQTTLRDAMSQFATGVTVLTAGGDHCHGMTANAFTSVSLEPPLVLCCVTRTSRLYEAVMETRCFGVSMLAADQEDLARYFADKRRPQGLAQFDAIDWWDGEVTGVPLLSGALAWLECLLVRVYDGGDHVIFLGNVLNSSRVSGRQALGFFAGAFHSVTPPAARSA